MTNEWVTPETAEAATTLFSGPVVLLGIALALAALWCWLRSEEPELVQRKAVGTGNGAQWLICLVIAGIAFILMILVGIEGGATNGHP